MKKIKFSTAKTILLIIAAFVDILIWFITSEKFDYLVYDKDVNEFIRTSLNKTETLTPTQETLFCEQCHIWHEQRHFY